MSFKNFTALYQKKGQWYLGWVEEVPGVNTQGHTLKEARENLKEALELVIETNRSLHEKVATRVIREQIRVSF